MLGLGCSLTVSFSTFSPRLERPAKGQKYGKWKEGNSDEAKQTFQRERVKNKVVMWSVPLSKISHTIKFVPLPFAFFLINECSPPSSSHPSCKYVFMQVRCWAKKANVFVGQLCPLYEKQIFVQKFRHFQLIKLCTISQKIVFLF